MRAFAFLLALVACLAVPSSASAQIGMIDGRIVSKFGGQIDTSAKADGYVLTYQSSTGKWIAAVGSTFSPTITSATTGDLLRYNGSAWVNATTSVAIDTLGSTRGQILYRNATVWTALSPGTVGYLLASGGAGADPSYVSPSATLDVLGSTRGSVLYRGASGWAILAPGTSTHVLTSNGAGADPSWQAGGGGGSSGMANGDATAPGWAFTSDTDTGFYRPAADSLSISVGGAEALKLNGNGVTGPTGNSFYLQSASGASGLAENGTNLNFTAGDASSDGVDPATTGTAGNIQFQGSTGYGGGEISFIAGGASGPGDCLGITFHTGTPTDGASGPFTITIPDAVGTNRSSGIASFQLGNKTGSGTASSFVVKGAAAATIFKVAYDGTLSFTSNSTGAGIPAPGANCPAVTVSAPYTWQKVISSDGSTCYVALYK